VNELHTLKLSGPRLILRNIGGRQAQRHMCTKTVFCMRTDYTCIFIRQTVGQTDATTMTRYMHKNSQRER